MYMILIEQQKMSNERQKELLNTFANILDNGYTYQDIKQAILKAYNGDKIFPFYIFKQPCENNLIKQGTMYYHKELKLMNSLPVVNHDIDSGTITSSKTEFYLEPVASYTLDDLLKYFYSKNMADIQEFNPKRMKGMFKHMVQKYGLDKLLFMIEGAARMYDSEQKVFTLNDFDSYSSTASQYLEEIKNNCKYSGGDKYVPRKRMLFG